MIYLRFIFSFFVYVWSTVESAQKLNEFIRHYESLSYDTDEVHKNHLRAKRSTTSDPFVHINFHARGRHFHLRIRPDTSAFANNYVMEGPDGEVTDFDLSHIYAGHLWGESGTKVYGSVRNGVFEGKIHTPTTTYYVERTTKYFGQGTKPFHSIIYSEDDVEYPFKHKQTESVGGCAVTENIYSWMQDIGNSAVVENGSDDTAAKQQQKSPSEQHRNRRSSMQNGPHNIYTREAQNFVTPNEASSEKRACSLYIQTDTYLWDHIKNYEQSDTSVKEEITSLISQHIKAVNYIYESTDFDGFRGIKFVVQRITINDTTSCEGNKRNTNPFCVPNIDVSNFLNLNSQFNHDDFCLAYIFTYRDFSGGTLGLAWVASASGASGGICEKYKSYTENIQGKQVQTRRSLNTGVITFVNYNSRVPPKVSELTLAHEIGHNFGSPHDYPHECRPGGAKGNYIMYASATSGDRPNNNKFSPCSVHNISAVLRAVFSKEGKENCFEKDDGAFCGNKIVEDGEECDCGYDRKECSEACCYPRDVEPYKSLGEDAKACKLRPLKQCSPSQGPCCNADCEFINRGILCKMESDCNDKSFCDGGSALCPPPNPKPNKTVCNEGTQVCWNGECIGSICQKYDMEECFLTDSHGAKPEQMCEVACQNIGKQNSCRSTYEIAEMKSISGIKLRPGSPCNDFQGYCDVFQKCRAVDAEGPLARLKNLILNKHTLRTIKQWVTNFWWAVMLMLICLAIFMGLFIKCCAVHTPSSNPRKAPALRITDTLRHPADTLRRKRHRPAQQAPPTGPPPPYPGPRPSAPPAPGAAVAGPSHGYGEGRGHYNRRGTGARSKMSMEDSSYAPAHPGRGGAMEMRGKPRA